MPQVRLSKIATCLLALGLAGTAAASTLITNAILYDGSGAPGKRAAVRIDQDKILEVGKLRPRPGEQVINARGRALAPGFIDSHSHHDIGAFADRSMPALLSQGVTTIVVGQDGRSEGSATEVEAKFTARPPSINMATYTGHGWLRDRVMGKDFKRLATPAELASMQALLAADLRAGSLGLSTGLEYDPGIYSDKAEVLALTQTAAAGGGRYISHLRNEDLEIDGALDELLDLGRQTGIPVQVSHIKLAAVDRWGDAAKVIAKLNAARAQGIQVTADVYPYEYWQSLLTVLLPKRDFTDLAAARLALTQMTTPEGMLLGLFAPHPAYAGKTLAQIAKERQEEPAATYLWLVRTAEAWRAAHPDEKKVDSIVVTAMSPKDVADFVAWQHSNICTDGLLDSAHPRGYGAFAKVLRQYVREEKRITLSEAVRKMTSLAADHVGLPGRGRIQAGYQADLVLFDPDKVADKATVQAPNALAVGVEQVWVNGVAVWRDGKATGAYSGRFLKRGQP